MKTTKIETIFILRDINDMPLEELEAKLAAARTYVPDAYREGIKVIFEVEQYELDVYLSYERKLTEAELEVEKELENKRITYTERTERARLAELKEKYETES